LTKWGPRYIGLETLFEGRRERGKMVMKERVPLSFHLLSSRALPLQKRGDI